MPATTRQGLLASGCSRATVDRRISRGALIPVYPGIYACDATWESLLQAHLLRGGPGSVVSHRAAARLHGLDGFKVEATREPPSGSVPVDVTVPICSSLRTRPAIRSGTLLDADVTAIRGLPVTSVVRTLLDLGRFATLAELELALESALRGDDPMRPDRWKEHVLDELVARLGAGARGGGVAAIRDVLAQRPFGVRPTGSYAETILLQGLRPLGLGTMLRQPTVRLLDRSGRLLGRWYPDLFDVESGVTPETDGEAGHASLPSRRRDSRRDNQLGNYVRILRYPASDVLADAGPACREIASIVQARRAGGWQARGASYTFEGNVITIRQR